METNLTSMKSILTLCLSRKIQTTIIIGSETGDLEEGLEEVLVAVISMSLLQM